MCAKYTKSFFSNLNKSKINNELTMILDFEITLLES